MTQSDPRLGSENHATTLPGKEGLEVSWPMSYRLLPSKIPTTTPLQNGAKPTKRCWSHNLYRGPADKKVEILYSKTKHQSETIARKFLHEPLIGFDMEWPWDSNKRSGLQNKVSLIQIACEDKIALFHIGLHQGKTTDDLIAPSLRKIIESNIIGKIGVCVLAVDFSRLKSFFKLEPKGAIELSHLYRLVKFGASQPKLVTTKFVSLARQVEEELGLPLYKGNVRTSDWSKSLSQKQIDYAAGDAYAGYMLYHCMNAKRQKMDPVPPLPIHAERFLPFARPTVRPVQLEPLEEGGEITTADTFFRATDETTETQALNNEATMKQENETQNQATSAITRSQNKKRIPKHKKPTQALDTASKKLYKQLVLRRQALAEDEDMPTYIVAANAVLESMAYERPTDEASLLKIKGIGEYKMKKYGAEWLEVIRLFQTANQPSRTKSVPNVMNTTQRVNASATYPGHMQQPMTPTRRARRTKEHISPDSSPAFGTPPTDRLPQLHTGLSFTLAETKFGTEMSRPCKEEPAEESDDASQIITPLPGSLSRFKRKRTPTLESSEIPATLQNVHGMGLDGAGDMTDPGLQLSSVNSNGNGRTAIIESNDRWDLPPLPFTPRSQIFRNKLAAFSKLVTRKLKEINPDAGPIVADWTLDRIVATSPRTLNELRAIPGIEGLELACNTTNMDILKNIIKFSPA